MSKIIYPELSYEVQGVIFDVYIKLGPSHKEEVYQRAMLIALSQKGLKVISEKTFEIFYKRHRVGLYRPDIIVEDKIILELKAVPEVSNLNLAQLISYLNITKYELGILINFGGSSPYFQRVANQKNNERIEGKLTNINIESEKIKEILKASKEMHRILGPGFFHQVYRRAAGIEFHLCKIKSELIKKMQIKYGGEILSEKEIRLYLIQNKILLWVRAVKEIDNILIKEMRSYLKHFDKTEGIIVNFNSEKLIWKLVGRNSRPY